MTEHVLINRGHTEEALHGLLPRINLSSLWHLLLCSHLFLNCLLVLFKSSLSFHGLSLHHGLALISLRLYLAQHLKATRR